MIRGCLLLGGIILAAGCAGNGIRTQARAAIVTRQVLVSFQERAKTKRIEDQQMAIEALRQRAQAEGRAQPYQEDARAAVLRVRHKWAPVVARYNAAVAAHRLWVDWLLVYVERDEIDTRKLIELVKSLVTHWDALRQGARSVALDLPEAPAQIKSLLEVEP